MIIENPAQIAGMSIEEVAKKCNTSKSSILRLTQKLGFSGFSEFKSCLKWENQNKIVNHQDAFESIRKDFMNTCQHLEASSHLEKIAQRIHIAQNVVLYGTGQAQRYCAMEMQRLFMEVSSPLKLAENLEHNSFMNFLTVIEYIFLTYLKYATD